LENENKEASITFKLLQDEKEELVRQAKTKDTSLSHHVRQLLTSNLTKSDDLIEEAEVEVVSSDESVHYQLQNQDRALAKLTETSVQQAQQMAEWRQLMAAQTELMGKLVDRLGEKEEKKVGFWARLIGQRA
jgi:hypothetical protein